MRIYREMARLLMVVACASLVATSADAASLILNGSFEEGAFVGGADQTMSLASGSTTMSGWTVVGDSLAWITDGPPDNPWNLSANAGVFFLDLTDFDTGLPFGGVTQTIATDVGSDYLLSFYLGSSSQWGGPSSILATAGSASGSCSAVADAIDQWKLCGLSFTALAASTAITLVGTEGFQYIGLDSVSVELVDGNGPPVPEPASIVLLGVGAAGLLARSRRHRKAHA